MRTSLGVLLVGLLVAAPTPARPDDPEAARAVVLQGIKAAGGADNLAKMKTATWKEKGTYYGMGEGLPYTGTYSMAFPDKFRMEIEGVFVSVFNVDKGWTKMGDETKEMSAEQIAAQKSDHKAGWVASLAPLTEKEFTFTSLGEVAVDKKPAVGVEVTRPGYPKVKLYFDKKSHLLLKSEWPSKAAEEMFRDCTTSIYYSDYKKIEGVEVATRMVMKRDGKLFVESEVLEFKPGKIDPKAFEKP